MDLEIELYSDIDKLRSNWETSSVGKYNIMFAKSKSGYWENLIKDKMKKPQNMGIWYEMQNKYEEDFKQSLQDKEEKENKAFETKITSQTANKRKKDIEFQHFQR